MGLTAVLDTNIVIGALGGLPGHDLPMKHYALSIIGRMELLCFPGMTPAQQRSVEELLLLVMVIPLEFEIERDAIALRRAHRLALPDAIIAATARYLDIRLYTNDRRLLQVPELRAFPVPIQ